MIGSAPVRRALLVQLGIFALLGLVFFAVATFLWGFHVKPGEAAQRAGDTYVWLDDNTWVIGAHIELALMLLTFALALLAALLTLAVLPLLEWRQTQQERGQLLRAIAEAADDEERQRLLAVYQMTYVGR